MRFFDRFSRKPDVYQISEYLQNHPIKDKYFYRLLQYDKLDDKMIYALDNAGPRMITFDPWPQHIFLNATGLKTISQFTIETAKTYRGKVPLLLEQTIVDEVEKLIMEGIIALSDDKVTLEKHLLGPFSNNKL
jgi:hypothetical protein